LESGLEYCRRQNIRFFIVRPWAFLYQQSFEGSPKGPSQVRVQAVEVGVKVKFGWHSPQAMGSPRFSVLYFLQPKILGVR
jgi:hypothetical protein